MTEKTDGLELREIYWGSGGDMARTWWCRGHVEDEAFASALNMKPEDLALERLWGAVGARPNGRVHQPAACGGRASAGRLRVHRMGGSNMTMQDLILGHTPRKQMAARLAACCVWPDIECWYFGCIDGPGHFIRGPGSTTQRYVVEHELTALFAGIDGRLCWNSPRTDREHLQYDRRDETEGRAFITHRGGWTALAFWDRSVDRRGACNSAFFVRETLTFAQIVRVARYRWPQVWARFSFQVVEVDAQGRDLERIDEQQGRDAAT